MDHSNNNFGSRPPKTDLLSPSLPDNYSASNALSTRDLILKCIANQKNGPDDKSNSTEAPVSLQDDINKDDLRLQSPLRKRTKPNNNRQHNRNLPGNIGILRNNAIRRQPRHGNLSDAQQDINDEAWHLVTTQNNNMNITVQAQWRGALAIPIDLSRENRNDNHDKINTSWTSRYGQPSLSYLQHSHKNIAPKRIRFSLPQMHPHNELDSVVFQYPSRTPKDRITKATRHRKRSNTDMSNAASTATSTQNLLNDMKINLHSRAEQKITRIATWNINNGFDHLAIASIMAKNDIDILALQEPRISYSTKDDFWLSTMRKELRKCKYEIITSQFSYIIFDEQTSGAALASIIRQQSKVQGRLLSVTFKSDDIWEVHTVISIYAVTNAKSGKKYARSHNSRKDVNNKLTKALQDELQYLQEKYGDAPITIVGDFQETIHADWRDNIGSIGKNTHPSSPLHMLIKFGFQSAYHTLKPNQQQVTRWNGNKTAGRHIDLQMLNDAASNLLASVRIDDTMTRNHITSDHLIVIADFNIKKVEQNIIESHRTKVNFRKIAGIKMKCTKTLTKCPITSQDITNYNVAFDANQFMSSMVQDQLKLLKRWQHEADSDKFENTLQNLEHSIYALERDTALEDNQFNDQFAPDSSPVQRKLVERNPHRRAQLDSIYDTFQQALYKIAMSLKLITTENKHVDALCTRQLMKSGMVQRYGEKIINLAAPTSKFRSALGDLKNAEATLRNLHHIATNQKTDSIDDKTNLQRSFHSLSNNEDSFKQLIDATSQIAQIHEENLANEIAVSIHRRLDTFSGRWNECYFSADICKNLISQTNGILKNNNVTQHVGMEHLDHSSFANTQWSNLDNWWSGPDLTTLANSSTIDINDPEIAEAIQSALTKTRKLKKKAISILVHNKEKLMTHNSRMNHTSCLSRQLNPKVMDEPEAHHVILDPTNIHAKSNVRCRNFKDCLDNTLLYHQNWMDRSGSDWEHHWFKTTKRFDHISGISFNFRGKPTDKDFERLVKQHQNCSEEIKLAFQDAHSEAIASVMQPPQFPHRAFDWTWHPNSSSNDWYTFEEDYWKAISSIPGKARYNAYTMAVIGRLPRRWIDLHLRIMKLMMVLRILPKKTKIQARVPIPKPKPGETRPLSLIHDDMCFILGFLTKHFTLKCEEIKLFPPTLHAYRQGMSTSFITLVDLATREDAISFGRYMALTAEDEEKFFDRVSLEVQLAVLFILGFPMEGFLEMKAEEMDNISVEIHTRHGQVIGKFLHGLKQGSPLSVLISNATLVFKHRVWGLRDPLATDNDPNGYSMSTWNKSIDGDAPPLVSMEGFCDDNSKWNMGNGRDFATIIKAVQWNIKLAGDLSMIFKIGRRGDKTIIELFNVDLQDIYLLPTDGFTSIAWDFKANRPTKEEVDCRVYLKSGLSLPSAKPDNLSDSVWSMLIKGTSLKSERSLGIWRNKLGDTSDSAEKRAFLFGAKLDRLNLSSLKHDQTIKTAINSLVIPVYQFGILENTCCPAVYDKMDTMLINKVYKNIGYAWGDAKQLMFVPEQNFGLGIRSVSVEMLKSICRELEVQLNDEDLIGKVLRGRLEAFKDASFRHAGTTSLASYNDINQGIRNFLMAAIRHIAHYGFFIRDMSDTKTTYQVESAIILAQQGSFFKSFKHQTVGMIAYAGMGSKSGATLGFGDTNLLWSVIYGRCHTLLTGCAIHSNVKLNFSGDQLRAIRSKATDIFQNDLCALYTVFEWSNGNTSSNPQATFAPDAALLAQLNSSINNTRQWRRISALSCLKSTHIEDVISEDEAFRFLDGLLNSGRRALLQHIDTSYIQPNRLTFADIETLTAQGWPLIVATDGGAGTFSTTTDYNLLPNASAGVVMFYPPNIPFAQYMGLPKEQQNAILDNNLIPWKARASSMPPKIGNHTVDNAHAECFAIIIMEEWLPHDAPIILIMDSEAERNRYQQLRDIQHTTNRFLIRSLLAGVSKCLGCRLANALSKHASPENNLSDLFHSNIIEFCLHAKKWCYNNSGEQSLWKLDQWAPGQLRSVWAIRSHQLESDFNISPKNRYGAHLIPNRAFVSANQWVDNICNAILRFKSNATISRNGFEMRKWCSPNVSLGLTGPNFIITLNGICLDRCVSTAVEEACTQEFIRRFAQRPTQGLLIRLQHDLFIKPTMIGRQSYHRRFLEGKTKTHTRAIYTDSIYRKAIVYKYAKDEDWTENTDKFRLVLREATKSYKYRRCPFCVHRIMERDKHIFREHATENSGLLGNSRHFHFYCLNDKITAVRQQMTQLLEDHLTHLFRLAAKWGRLGFSSLLERVVNALTMLDRASYHNAHLKNPTFTKPDNTYYACLSGNDWISFFESQGEHIEAFGKRSFYQWPLVHQFGFITANSYTLLEMQDGEYSPCDLLPFGIIPTPLQDIISQFANELGTRHSQEAKKDFVSQWHQVRAAAWLRGLSLAMVTGAQISDHKNTIVAEMPTSLSQETPNVDNYASPAIGCGAAGNLSMIKRQMSSSVTNTVNADQFLCAGLTCSSIFTLKTNLRSSFMRKKGDICRRCTNMNKAILYTKSFEKVLENNIDSFRNFYSHVNKLESVTVDDIISAISKVNPMPEEILPVHLKRATKRNVYPIVTMNMVRLLAGTFKWNISSSSTSIDTVLNQAMTNKQTLQTAKWCICRNENTFFTVGLEGKCPNCSGTSTFTSTEIRIKALMGKASATNANDHTIKANITPGLSRNDKRSLKRKLSNGVRNHSTNILSDITNIPPRTPLCLPARPNDTELNTIAQTNSMLSNFVVSYFFKLLAIQFNDILYEDFLFDLVKSEGSWKRFVESSRSRAHYQTFFNNLSNRKMICIIPICHNGHWTVLVRRFSGNSWNILFIDSILQDSDQRFRVWKELFADDNLFSGSWIKVKVLRQCELECGARVCLNGLCFATSQKKAGDIINDLSRFKDLNIRSRAMVSTICKDGFWSPQQWLRRIIGEHPNAVH